MAATVLIVPSGIETWNQSRGFNKHLVLIVPSGIETTKSNERQLVGNDVLIVPSGIETKHPCSLEG